MPWSIVTMGIPDLKLADSRDDPEAPGRLASLQSNEEEHDER